MVSRIDSVPATTPVCIHVGYHKCASTTLQKNFFANHPQVADLRKGIGRSNADRAIQAVAEHATVDAVQKNDVDLLAAAKLWQNAEAKVRESGRLPLYSWENLTRAFFFRTPTDQRLAKALRDVVGNARIVIVIRHQIRLLESLYLSRIKPPNYVTPEEWFEKEGNRTAAAYQYADVISTFEAVFGADNVLVLLFEEIASNPDEFARRLSEHVGIDPRLGVGLLTRPAMNSRPSAAVHLYSRIRRSIFRNVSFGSVLPEAWLSAAYRLLSKGRRSDVVFPALQVSALEQLYRPQNRRLVDGLGLDLERFGYPL